MQELTRSLLNWYDAAKRDLPWRHERNPYKILVSEIMLQQTRVETVIPYFQRFVETFPTLDDLAGANEEQVLKLWTGLGYYRRARYLHQAAREIQTQYGGRLPQEPEKLRKLPGVGRYTAAAVASIAYNRPAAAVDGNVLRVMARVKEIDQPVNKPATARLVEKYVFEMMPPERAGDFTQALMELGSLVCLPQNPLCDRCPIQQHCMAFQKDRVAELPLRQRAVPPTEEKLAVLVAVAENAVLLEQRPGEGLLAGMWQFPNVPLVEDGDPRKMLEQRFCINSHDQPLIPLPTYRHRFSHRIWHVIPFLLRVRESVQRSSPITLRGVWQPFQQVEQLAIPNAFLPLIQICLDR